MKNILKYLPLAFVTLFMAACQDNNEENFANKAYIDAAEMASETVIKGNVGTITKTLTIATSRPAENEINAQITVEKSMVGTYNKAYYANAELLPDTCYKVKVSKMTINKGSVKSTEASIDFSKLGSLDRSKTYVLPVTVQTSDIDLLASAKQYYYVFRAGALINVVADIQDNYLEIYPWKNESRVANMHKITMEALIFPREFGQLISTVMGIEGSFLMRIGDAGIPDNQIQIATSEGNFTDSNLKLTPGVWSHVAMTYDESTKTICVYINGKLMASDNNFRAYINIVGNGGDRNFEIGRSYDDSRDLNGCISEARIWDVVRTQEEIANSIYTVEPTFQGLVAYWKFDDQSSFIVKDYSGNGNDIKAIKSALKWQNVSLPATN